MRKVTADELHALSVKSGPDMPLPASPVELMKATICSELERLYGNDKPLWIRVLRRLKKRVRREPGRTAIRQILEWLEASKGECARVSR